MFEIQESDTIVRLWSMKPLKHGIIADPMRLKLAEALKRLTTLSGHLLQCEHFTTEKTKADIENTLIYNVGESSFSSISRDGIGFRLSYLAPDPAPSGCLYLSHPGR